MRNVLAGFVDGGRGFSIVESPSADHYRAAEPPAVYCAFYEQPNSTITNTRWKR